MIMKVLNFESEIILSDEYVRVLEIENKVLFSNIVQSIFALCYNEESKEYILLLDEDKELNFAKDVCLVIDPLNINFNDRKVINKLYHKINVSMDLNTRNELEKQLYNIFNIINELVIEFPFEFTYKSDVESEELLKLFNFRLFTKEQSIIEKLFYYIDLISLLDLYKVLILCNIKTFFTDEQIQEIYKYAIYNKLYILLIEGNLVEKVLAYERKIRIDEDFDDYEIK